VDNEQGDDMRARGRGAAIALVGGMTAAVLAGCGDDDAAVSAPSGEGTSTPRPAATAPFDAKTLVPDGYAVTSTTAMPLGPSGEADYRVVGSAAADAVKGGTHNVQVFAYRAGAWTEVFDAADKAVPYEMQGDFGSPESDESPDPVLNQRHWIDEVEVQAVRFGLDSPSLVIYGEDRADPHVLGVLAVVDFVTEAGEAHLDHYEMAQDLNKPAVIGDGDAQTLEVPNYWYPWLNGGDPAEYLQTVGLSGDEGVAVIGDTRPWIGAWVGVGAGPGVMVGDVVPDSPAAGTLRPGDRIVSVNGNNPEQGLGPQLLSRRPGDEVTLTIDRAGTMSEVTLALSDMSKAPTFWEYPERATIGLEVAPLSGRPGIAITDVEPGSPAAESGLKKGDAIQRIGDFPMSDPSDLDAAISGRAGEELEVEVQGVDGTNRTVRMAPETSEDPDPQVALL
jgi:hypothetical protein